ncbi:MAG TPA: helix-turn-helix transcriptional regulator [Candidatus Dojkabacteria bacterium]|nr:helix-turn-helix transcriptional regulator [Candidatus Dojkabacteria bacterium]
MKYDSVGKKIKDYRQKLNLTQQELADRVGVTWEMISRYERGKSSPFVQINEISKALNIHPSQLLQDNYKSSINRYEIPLFTSISTDLEFDVDTTQYFYTSPQWILEKDAFAFAVETRLVKINTLEIKDSGVLFISPTAISNTNSVVLVKGNNEIVCTRWLESSKNVLGVVLAQEIRFV